MKIIIESIPHKDQRYDTCGDYWIDPKDRTVHIKVSELDSLPEMLCIAIHELVEWALCDVEGIDNDEITSFDEAHDGADGSEPGDDTSAPYYKQHQIATGVERIVAAEMGVDWAAYEEDIRRLGNEREAKEVPVKDMTWTEIFKQS